MQRPKECYVRFKGPALKDGRRGKIPLAQEFAASGPCWELPYVVRLRRLVGAFWEESREATHKKATSLMASTNYPSCCGSTRIEQVHLQGSHERDRLLEGCFRGWGRTSSCAQVGCLALLSVFYTLDKPGLAILCNTFAKTVGLCCGWCSLLITSYYLRRATATGFYDAVFSNRSPAWMGALKWLFTTVPVAVKACCNSNCRLPACGSGIQAVWGDARANS